ncbi:S-adenosylmethionine decarboxylase family protein [Dactylosporangium darangshiense]|uniref:S-adenosylmethionine decarboxylase n=1 Tax=Dactylosporangium darangshiense TaxID=579108 RepID=A0ABP8DMJ9_9ACTN
MTPWGVELVLDLHGCNLEMISDGDVLRRFASVLVAQLGMTAWGEPLCERFALHDPDAAGYSLVQLITTSSITAHFAERSRTAFLNIFSCQPFDTDTVTAFVAAFFDASHSTSRVIHRWAGAAPQT